MNQILKNHKLEIEVLCQNYGVKSLYAVGHTCSENFDVTQEIDLVIDFNGLPGDQLVEKVYQMNFLFERVFRQKVEVFCDKTGNRFVGMNGHANDKLLLYGR